MKRREQDRTIQPKVDDDLRRGRRVKGEKRRDENAASTQVHLTKKKSRLIAIQVFPRISLLISFQRRLRVCARPISRAYTHMWASSVRPHHPISFIYTQHLPSTPLSTTQSLLHPRSSGGSSDIGLNPCIAMTRPSSASSRRRSRMQSHLCGRVGGVEDWHWHGLVGPDR